MTSHLGIAKGTVVGLVGRRAVGVLLVALLVGWYQPTHAQNPTVGDPVTPDTVAQDLRDLPSTEPWKRGDPARDMPDMRQTPQPQNNGGAAEALCGLRAVRLLLLDTAEKLSEADLDGLRTQTQTMLYEAGITVIDWQSDGPKLTIMIDVEEHFQGSDYVRLHVQLNERVALLRDPWIQVEVTTWEKTVRYPARPEKLTGIGENLRLLLEETFLW